MKIFEKNGKINFVDANNVFVGFDYTQCCCEDFGWSITPDRPTKLTVSDIEYDVDGYTIDTNFFEDDLPKTYTEDGGVAVFRLVKDDCELFLTLWNCHNGYYAHGFTMEIGGTQVRTGYI